MPWGTACRPAVLAIKTDLISRLQYQRQVRSPAFRVIVLQSNMQVTVCCLSLFARGVDNNANYKYAMNKTAIADMETPAAYTKNKSPRVYRESCGCRQAQLINASFQQLGPVNWYLSIWLIIIQPCIRILSFYSACFLLKKYINPGAFFHDNPVT